MPKKKKGKPSGDSETGGWTSVKRRAPAPRAGAEAAGDGKPITSGDAESGEDARTKALCYLQEMFAGKLDPVVVHMIMNDCEFKVEAALETLFQLAEQTSPVESQLFRLSGFKDVYIPSADTEEQDDDEEEEDDDDDQEEYVDAEDTLFRENLGSGESPSLRLKSRGNDGSVQLPSRDLGPHIRDALGVRQDEDATEDISGERRADSLSDFPLKRKGAMPRQEFLQSFPKKQNPFIARGTPERQNHPLNNLSKVEASDIAAQSRDDGREGSDRSRVAAFGPSPDSSYKLNIHGPSLGNRDSFLSEGKDDQFADGGASARGDGTREYTYPSNDLDTDGPQMPLSQTQKLVEQLLGKSSVPSLEEGSKQTSPGADIFSGSSPVDLPSDELDALLGEIEMCPEKLSASEDTVEPVVADHHVNLASEASNDGADLEDWGDDPEKVKRETDFQKSRGHVTGNMKPSHHSTPIREEDAGDKNQKGNLNTAAPAFVPRAYARHPSPTGHQQFPPQQGFQPRPAHRMPRVPHPAGRASSLRKHLNQFEGQVGKPFFAPFPSSQEQRPNLPRGVERLGWNSPNQTQSFRHPAQKYQPPESRFRPISKSQSPAPFVPQNPASHPLLKTPSAPNQNSQLFGPRRAMSPAHGMPRGGTLPSGGLRSNSPREGARQALGPPQWPVNKQTSYAPRETGHNQKKPGLEDRALPLPEGKVLCLMRGCPGSGKSTLARQLVGNGRILSTDDYFIDGDGKYHFDVTKLSDAHDWSHERAKEAMESGVTPLIIDNTNIERWTMKPYVAMALHYGYAVEFQEPTTPWKFKLGKLFKYNTHGVPKERIKLMIERFERDVTVENILGSSKPKKKKKKTDEAEQGPSSQGSWRRTKKEDKKVPKVSSEEPAAGCAEANSKKLERGDTTTYKKEEGGDDITTTTDALKEDIENGEEMFMSDDEDGFDALMDSMASDSTEGMVGKPDEGKVNEDPQEDARERIGKEDGQMVTSLEKAASFEIQEKAGPGKTDDQVSESRNTDIEEDAENLPVRTRPEESQELVKELFEVEEATSQDVQLDKTGDREADDEDDFLAMMNVVAEASCCPPLAEIPSLEDGEHPQGNEQGLQQINNPAGSDAASELTSATQASFTYPPGFELLARIPEQKGDTANKQSSSDDDDFTEMMSLIANSSCIENDQPVPPGRDGVATDAQHSEIKLATSDSQRVVLASSPHGREENPNEAQTDANLTEGLNTGAAATRVATLVNAVQDAEQSKEQIQKPQLQEKEEAAVVGTYMSDAELTSIKEQSPGREKDQTMLKDDASVQDDSLAEETTHILTSHGVESSATNLDIQADSVLKNASDGDGDRECLGTDSLLKNALSTLKGLGETDEKAGTEVKTNAGVLDTENTTTENVLSGISENGRCSVEKPSSEEQLGTIDVDISTADKHGNHSDGQPSVTVDFSDQTDSVSVGKDKKDANADVTSSSTQPTSSSDLRASTSRCRSPSPRLLVTSSIEESRTNQERRKLRRSKSHNKSTKMAAVFPTLSPGSENWSELAELGQGPEVKSSEPGNKSPTLGGVTFAEAGTVTLPSDFSCVQRLQSGEMTVEDLQQQGFRVAVGQPRQIAAPSESDFATEREEVISETLSSSSSASHSPIPVTVRLHKSTMTDPEEQTEDIDANLRSLIALFPTVSQTDLQDILTKCAGNLEWVTNILLDDFGNKERIGQDLQAPDQLSNKNQQEQAGFAKGESDGDELQISDEKLARVAAESMKDVLEAKQVSQAENLATNMISVVDDILKTISSKGSFTGADNNSLGNQLASEREKTGSGYSDHLPVLHGEDLSTEMETKLHSSNLDSATSFHDPDTNVGSDIITSDQVPTEPHQSILQDEGAAGMSNLYREQEESNFSSMEPKANEEGSSLRAGNLHTVYPSGILEAADFDSQILLGETKNESHVLEGPSSFDKLPSSGRHHQDGLLDQDSSAFRSDFLESVPFLDPSSLRTETKEEQVVRPKTSSRTTSRLSPTKASKAKKPKDPDIDKKMKRIKEAEASPNRQELEVPGGVQFSWNNHREVEEFRVPRAEQTMTGHDDAFEIVKDESVMTEEQADAILQNQPVQKKLRELGSLEEGLMLQLPPAFALQLQEMFGSIGFHLLPDGLPAEDLQVHVDYDLAKQLHMLWAKTLQTRFDKDEELESIITADEELARQLQQEEDIHHMTKVQASRSAKYQSPKASPKAAKQPISLQRGYGDGRSTMGGFVPMGPPRPPAEEVKSLREIMEEELAAQLSKDVEVEEKLSTDGSVSIATKMKRDKLYSEFPTLDRDALEEIFRNNNYQFDPTVLQIKSFFMSASGQPKNVYSNEALERIEKELIEAAERESLASSEGTDESNPQDASYQSTDNPDYQDYRAEATQHYKQRHEAFQKAAAAYGKGQKELASFFSQQGHLHTEKLKYANKRASEAILTSKNSLFNDNTLDLHGLHVDEALLILNQVLNDKKAELAAYDQQQRPLVSKSPQRHIFIITGKGNRSRGGVARIRPAVTDLLKREGYRFSMPNAGLMKVAL
ncbi:uncharacterized protein LOC119733652 isoform X2 [Patiria miniata]|uniref:CUE domain-containing protein n=1 Tax=Patiria miniata TaxID=46514 RepID=A0A914AG77_PATMI|nr:uncharacterized protein LOC119733652 isoform X2 [Patiria miniata]